MDKAKKNLVDEVDSKKENTISRTFTKELSICTAILSLAFVYSFSYIIQECNNDNQGNSSKKNLQLAEGWSFFSRRQDVADFEWLFWFSEARNTLITVITGHLLISLVTQHFYSKIKRDCLFLYGLVAIFWLFGAVVIAWLITMCFFYYYLSRKSTIFSVIGCTLGLLLAIQQLPHAKYNFILSEMDYSILVKSGLSYAVFRCCSFALEAQQGLPSSERSFYDLLRFNFYIPYFFFGPVITFNAFQNQNKYLSSTNIWHFLKEASTTFLYILSVDFLRHFLYLSSLPHDSNFMINAPLTVIGFLAFGNFFLDWIKGKILYSVSSGIAKNIDGYVDAPVCCKNVATICTFADTYFDRGLQQFVCRYAYDFLSKTHEYVTEEALAGAVSFLIVISSQGFTSQLCIWAFLNWFGLTFEFYLVKKFGGVLGERVRALLLGLNYWLIVLFNCVAINGIEPFQLYFQRLFLTGGIFGLAQVVTLGYCYARLVCELQQKDTKAKSD